MRSACATARRSRGGRPRSSGPGRSGGRRRHRRRAARRRRCRARSARVERARAVAGDALVRPRQVGVAQEGADVARRAVGLEVHLGVEATSSKQSTLSCVWSKKVGRRRSPRGRRRWPASSRRSGPRPVAVERLVPLLDGAGHAGRQAGVARGAEGVAGAGPASMKVSGRMAAGAFSRPSIVVTLPCGVRMTMNPPPPMPAENGSVTPEHARGDHRRVDRVAAAPQRVDRGLGGERVDGRGRAAAADRGRLLLELALSVPGLGRGRRDRGRHRHGNQHARVPAQHRCLLPKCDERSLPRGLAVDAQDLGHQGAPGVLAQPRHVGGVRGQGGRPQGGRRSRRGRGDSLAWLWRERRRPRS